MTTQALFLRLMMLLKETFSYCLTLLLLLQAAVLSAQTRLSADDYIIRYKDIAIEKMQQYHIPASITLAQGLWSLETETAFWPVRLTTISELNATRSGQENIFHGRRRKTSASGRTSMQRRPLTTIPIFLPHAAGMQGFLCSTSWTTRPGPKD